MAKFTYEEKIQAVIRYEEGLEGVKSIAKSIGVDYSVLINWINAIFNIATHSRQQTLL